MLIFKSNIIYYSWCKENIVMKFDELTVDTFKHLLLLFILNEFILCLSMFLKNPSFESIREDSFNVQHLVNQHFVKKILFHSDSLVLELPSSYVFPKPPENTEMLLTTTKTAPQAKPVSWTKQSQLLHWHRQRRVYASQSYGSLWFEKVYIFCVSFNTCPSKSEVL